jgi:GntR family transcriptional regulator
MTMPVKSMATQKRVGKMRSAAVKRRVANKSPGGTKAIVPMHELLPLHHRIYIVLRRRLLEGVFKGDAPLPGEHLLAAEFSVSRETVRRVLDRLAQERLITRRHGVGTFPTVVNDAPASNQSRISYYDFIALSSQRYDDTLLEFAEVSTPAEVLREVVDFGQLALKVSRLRSNQGKPEHIVDSYVPAALATLLAGELTPTTLGNRTVLEVLKRRGVEAESSEMWISAVAADSFEASHLNVAIGAPLVHAIRVSLDARGRAIEFSRFHSVADRFGYRFAFDRNSIWARIPPDKNRGR